MKIVIIQHENDFKGEQDVYFIEVVAQCWRDAGHEVVFINGLQKNIAGDVALLHVNLSVVPDEYVQYAMQFPVVLNLSVTDIRKRKISKNLVLLNDDYDGPVIVKTDLNYGGIPEAKIFDMPLPKRRSLMKYVRRSVRKTRNLGIKLNLIDFEASRLVETEYRESFRVYDHKKLVPTNVWKEKDWIVEKFLPEIEGSEFVVRNAFFLGDKMICFKTYSSDPIVKEEKEARSKKIDIPKKIIHLRNKLGLDYGKIDFVMHNEDPAVLDIGRTIGGGDYGRDTALILAPGILSYLVTQNELGTKMVKEVLSRTTEPVFLMNPPLTLETNIPNNRTMSLLSDEEREINFDCAMDQWLELYRSLSKDALVYLLPSSKPLQDLTFVSNIGVILNHLENPVAIVSNFRAEGRQGESAVGNNFFRELGYNVYMPDTYFEGEADFKHLCGNVYFGGFGLRSSKESHLWMMDQFGAVVISIKLDDPHLYHLDCVLFVINKETILLCTSICDDETILSIEKHCRIIDVPIDLAYRGATNSVLCGSTILTESRVEHLQKHDKFFDVEKNKRVFMENIAAENELDISFFDLDEFHKSGAMLSCLVMPVCNTKKV